VLLLTGLLTSATESSVQLDLKSGTICRRTSDSRTCQAAVSDSRWRKFSWQWNHSAAWVPLLTPLW